MRELVVVGMESKQREDEEICLRLSTVQSMLPIWFKNKHQQSIIFF